MREQSFTSLRTQQRMTQREDEPEGSDLTQLPVPDVPRTRRGQLLTPVPPPPSVGGESVIPSKTVRESSTPDIEGVPLMTRTQTGTRFRLPPSDPGLMRRSVRQIPEEGEEFGVEGPRRTVVVGPSSSKQVSFPTTVPVPKDTDTTTTTTTTLSSALPSFTLPALPPSTVTSMPPSPLNLRESSRFFVAGAPQGISRSTSLATPGILQRETSEFALQSTRVAIGERSAWGDPRLQALAKRASVHNLRVWITATNIKKTEEETVQPDPNNVSAFIFRGVSPGLVSRLTIVSLNVPLHFATWLPDTFVDDAKVILSLRIATWRVGRTAPADPANRPVNYLYISTKDVNLTVADLPLATYTWETLLDAINGRVENALAGEDVGLAIARPVPYWGSATLGNLTYDRGLNRVVASRPDPLARLPFVAPGAIVPDRFNHRNRVAPVFALHSLGIRARKSVTFQLFGLGDLPPDADDFRTVFPPTYTVPPLANQPPDIDGAIAPAVGNPNFVDPQGRNTKSRFGTAKRFVPRNLQLQTTLPKRTWSSQFGNDGGISVKMPLSAFFTPGSSLQWHGHQTFATNIPQIIANKHDFRLRLNGEDLPVWLNDMEWQLEFTIDYVTMASAADFVERSGRKGSRKRKDPPRQGP